MRRKPAAWKELSPGLKVLKLYETKLNPKFPRIVLMDLTAELFEEFHRDPLAFVGKHELFPREESPSWTSHVAMPPIGKGIPQATSTSRWVVAYIHNIQTISTSAACPETAE
jgi:hypothetical protein